MNSVLNPEAPEFHPHLKTVIKDGYTHAKKSVKASQSFPVGNKVKIYNTYTDFRVVKYQLSENVIVETNQIVVNEIPAVRIRRTDVDEIATDKIVDVNDCMMDRINVHIDKSSGVYSVINPIVTWTHNPVISTIKLGGTTFIGAKNIPRPQFQFRDRIDNSDSLWVPKISDKPNSVKPLALNITYNENGMATGYEHPYKLELELYQPPPDALLPDPEPLPFPEPLDKTTLTYIDNEEQLNCLIKHLETVTEIAVDLEHHAYRTYQGITCLIQITTTEGGDFIIDALAVREHLHKLNYAFTDPAKIKVLHGAHCDVLWLQRDFGVYIVGMFDTYQAARILQEAALSLKYLLHKHCNIEVDKKYQLADWRLRPLPQELIEYARMDTHYLIYIWRQMKHDLLTKGDGDSMYLLDAFAESVQVCGRTYNKDVIDENSHIPLFLRSKKSFNSQQMAALRMLYKWRDTQAREQDESPIYLVPNHMLLALSESLPRELQGVASCCQPVPPPFIKLHMLDIHRIILTCRELPLEPNLYDMPTTIRYMMNMDVQVPAGYSVHDTSNDYMEEYGGNPDYSYLFESTDYFSTDLKVILPDKDETRGKNIGSKLNADAQLFIPPYDRYRCYRYLAQDQELKEYNEKKAKIAALSKGDKLIKEEVLHIMEQAQIKVENEPIDAPILPLMEPNKEREDADGCVEIVEPVDVGHKAAKQRKRKIYEKTETKEAAEPVLGTKVKVEPADSDAAPAGDAKPSVYDDVNYKKFYSGSGKGHKQPKMKFKKP